MKFFSTLTRSNWVKLPLFACGIVSLTLVPAKAQAPYQGKSKSVQIETLAEGGVSWDHVPYKAYPSAPPRLSVLKITLPPHSALPWHIHGIPVAVYVLSGKLIIEKESGEKKEANAGQAVLETVNSIHRGKTGNSSAELIVFYAGALGLPLAKTVQR
ncbi:MAG: cupin [Verrucomicrobia bacterium]|nr:MAG: cupin [Verrucomicrobiota bacterium]